MLIENPEALKGWLTNVLEPMCEADPNALAKYVIALVRKDKPVNELRESCIDQLDVFLQQETRPFVEMFFKTLESKSYLVKSETATPAPSPVNDHHVVATVPSPLPVAPLAIQTSVVTPLTNVPTSKIAERRPSRPETTAKSNEEDRDGRRVGRKLHSRSRSRSPSWNRNRSRSRSKDRDDRRGRRYPDDDRRRRPQHLGRRRYMDHRRDRSWDRDRRERERDRSHSRSRTPKSRSRSRSRSRSKDRKRASNRDSNHKAGSPNAALTTQDHGDKDYRFGPGPNPAPGATSVVSQTPGATPATATSPASTSVPSTGAIADTHPPGVQPFQPTPLTRRCRDYDEKGYCMRGDLCPFDHGADPVVVEDVNLPSMLGFGPSGPPPPPPQAPPPSVPPGRPLPPLLGPPPIPPLPQPPPPQTHSHPEPYIPEPYNPEAPTMDRMPRMRQPPFWGPRSGPGRGPGSRPLQNYPQHMTRELISVPTVDDSGDGGRVVRQHPGGPMPHPHRGGGFLGHKRPHMGPVPFPPPHLQQHQHPHLPHLHLHQHPLPPPPPGAARENVNPNEVPLNKKRAFDFNRLGPRKYAPDNSVLEIRKVPRGLNSITQLNNHFCKFGKIVNLQVSYQGDPEAALVTFSSHAEANAAYRSTEAVLNNRFIKVFWHNKEEDGEQQDAKQENNVTTSLASRKVSVKDRLGTPVGDKADGSETNEPETSAVILSPTGNLSKTVFNPSALRKTNVTTANAIKSSQPVQEVLKKKQEDQHEAQKMKVDLQKRQHELLQQQIQQQKLLIEKLEKNKTTTPAERAMIITTLKILQESIDNLKKELVVVKPASSQPKTKQEAQKELLDIEMELYNKQHQGVDTSDLQKKVAELRQEALSLGLDVTRGVGQLRGRGRGARAVVRGGMVTGVFRGRGRGTRSHAQSLQRSVDHRTRKLNVSGFEEEERDNIVAHLSQFGDVESADHDKETKKIKLSFKTRRDAEMAVRKGAKFKGRVLTLSWHREPGMSQSSISEGHGGILDDDDDEIPDHDGVGNDPLLVDDEEEEEDSEGRPWRR